MIFPGHRTWCSVSFAFEYFWKTFLNVHFDDKASKDTEAAATNVSNIRNQGNRQILIYNFLNFWVLERTETLSYCFSFVLASQLRGYVEHKKCYFSHTFSAQRHKVCVWPSNIWLKYLVHYPLCCKKSGIFNLDKNTHLKITQKHLI